MALTKISRGLLNTGVSDSSDATAITIDSSEKVGLNGLSAGDYWSSSNQLVFGNTASGANGGMTIATANDAVGQIYFADGTSGDARYRGQIQYTHVSDAMDFQTAAAFRMRIDSSGNVGIGTDAIPHGGIGAAKLAIDGGNQNFTTGPHVQFTTDADDYPVMQMLNYGHDNVSINFDTYHDGVGWKSADAGSNFQLYKLSDQLIVRSGSGVSAGSTISFTNSLAIDPNGQLYFNSGAGNIKAYGVRVWANINQSTDAIRDSGNVSSVSDEGTALYKINFSTSMPDTNYVLLGTASNENNLVGIDGSPPSTYTTSAVEVRIFDASNIGQELTNGILNIAVIR